MTKNVKPGTIVTLRREKKLGAKGAWVRCETDGRFLRGDVTHAAGSGNLTLDYTLDAPGEYLAHENWYGKVSRTRYIVEG
jgi:hypothetical protein